MLRIFDDFFFYWIGSFGCKIVPLEDFFWKGETPMHYFERECLLRRILSFGFRTNFFFIMSAEPLEGVVYIAFLFGILHHYF